LPSRYPVMSLGGEITHTPSVGCAPSVTSAWTGGSIPDHGTPQYPWLTADARRLRTWGTAQVLSTHSSNGTRRPLFRVHGERGVGAGSLARSLARRGLGWALCREGVCPGCGAAGPKSPAAPPRTRGSVSSGLSAALLPVLRPGHRRRTPDLRPLRRPRSVTLWSLRMGSERCSSCCR